ncbi:MAG: hypothetical protein ACP5DQ_04315 [Bacteroidales bacterium]
MKNINDLGPFDDHFLMEKLNKLGNPLRKLDKFIDWKIFESPLNEAYNIWYCKKEIFREHQIFNTLDILNQSKNVILITENICP